MYTAMIIAFVVITIIVASAAMCVLGFGGSMICYGLAAVLAPSFGKAQLFSFRRAHKFATITSLAMAALTAAALSGITIGGFIAFRRFMSL